MSCNHLQTVGLAAASSSLACYPLFPVCNTQTIVCAIQGAGGVLSTLSGRFRALTK